MSREIIKFLLVPLTAGILLLCSFRPAFDQDENTIKALFIYNFTKHIEWPKGKINGKFTIGIFGDTPVYEKLNTILRDRKIKDLPVEVKMLTSGEQVVACDVVFFSKNEGKRIKEITEQFDYYGVLVISDGQPEVRMGACINIIEKDEKMKFEIDDNAIRKEGLKISKQLYELAISK